MKNFRLWLPVSALAALTAAGCMLVTGQFVVTFAFAEYGYDPVTVGSPTALAGVPVDLNEVGTYRDHRDNLKDVVDLALVGRVTNLTGTPTAVEVWMVPSPGTLLATEAAVKAAGQKIWGSFTVPANGSVPIGWNQSAALFVGRKALIDEIKGDGRFDLYAMGGTGAYAFRIDKGALIAVVAAGN